MRLAVSLLFAAAWTPVAPIHAQRADTTVRVAVGFGVDTGSIPNQEIFALWRTYLSSRPGCLQPAPLWSPSEQARWPVVDLLCSYVYQGFTRFTVVDLAPAIGLDSTYLIRTLVGRVSDPGQDLQPLALYRVYATREGGRWVLANALPRVTRRWNHETIGRVTFVYPPTRRFVRARAQATAVFVDSLARAGAYETACRGIHERDAADRFVIPAAGHSWQRVGQHPPSSLTRRVDPVEGQWLQVLPGIGHSPDERADEVGAVQPDRRSEVHDGEPREPLVHIAAQQIDNRPPCLLGRRP